MWHGVITAAIAAFAFPWGAVPAFADTDCLTADEARTIVEQRRAIAPSRALRAARTSFPDHDVLRALLCRENNGYVYVVTVLSREGKVLRTRIDAQSGRTYR